MRSPTPEQLVILNSPARVRVVRAVPGSGKTWLVGELIRQELDKWTTEGAGIAALSFTRVGGDEIRRALSYELDHPHFVGTIDAFLFRYVVRPFYRICNPGFAKPRLIPGEWGAEHWQNYAANQSASVGSGINLFSCMFIDEEQGKAVVARKPHPAQPLQRLVGPDADAVKRGKMRLWQASGCLTHSDAALWASRILENQTFGATIRAEIVRRFPLLIVDELQDTGFFLGKSIRLLLGEPEVRGVVVGDPDQAIFEFTGARPALFEEFEAVPGAATLLLASSRRCPRSVAEVASYVKDSGGTIYPARDREGQTFLVRYNDMRADVERIANVVSRARHGREVKVIARSNQTIDELVGRHSAGPQRLGSPALYHIHRAVVAFRQGRQVAALAAVRTALDVAVFKHEGVSDDELRQSKIDPPEWRTLSVACLLSANALPTTGKLYEWQLAAGEILDTQLGAFRLDPSLNFATGNLRPQRRGKWDEPSPNCLPQMGVVGASFIGVPVQTVHGVKGETHDVTIFVCPSTGPAHCPSAIWWSEDDKDREERRIAYVAMTRTQGDLFVCVHEACFKRLAAYRPLFTASFRCVTVEECAVAFGEGNTV